MKGQSRETVRIWADAFARVQRGNRGVVFRGQCKVKQVNVFRQSGGPR
jgi:hypothetical protein